MEDLRDVMTVRLLLPSGDAASYDVAVIHVSKYTLEEIFEKGLLFLLPFYLFAHEKRFELYDRDEAALEELLEDYRTIMARLVELEEMGELDAFVKATTLDMMRKVTRALAGDHRNVKKGLMGVMGGRVLDHEARMILDRGRAEGRAEGKAEGRAEGRREGERLGELKMLFSLVDDGLIPIGAASAKADMSEDEFRARMAQR